MRARIYVRTCVHIATDTSDARTRLQDRALLNVIRTGLHDMYMFTRSHIIGCHDMTSRNTQSVNMNFTNHEYEEL